MIDYNTKKNDRITACSSLEDLSESDWFFFIW